MFVFKKRKETTHKTTTTNNSLVRARVGLVCRNARQIALGMGLAQRRAAELLANALKDGSACFVTCRDVKMIAVDAGCAFKGAAFVGKDSWAQMPSHGNIRLVPCWTNSQHFFAFHGIP